MRRAERNPDLWFRGGLNESVAKGQSTYTAELDRTRALVAEYLGSKKADTVIVDNASHGINAILRSVPAMLRKKGVLCVRPRRVIAMPCPSLLPMQIAVGAFANQRTAVKAVARSTVVRSANECTHRPTYGEQAMGRLSDRTSWLGGLMCWR